MNNSRKNFINKRTLSNLIVVCVGVLLYILLSNFGAVRNFFGWLGGIFYPFVIGLCLAYLLNIPVRFFERRVFHRFTRKHGLAVGATYLLAFIVLGLLLGLVLPQVWESIFTLVGNIPSYLNNLNQLVTWFTQQFDLDPTPFRYLMMSYEELLQTILGEAQNWLPNLANWLPTLGGILASLGTGLVGMLTGLIASIYMLLARDRLLRQCRRVLYALLPRRRADETQRVAGMANRVFSGFISGKIIDSAIIGAICFVFMSVINAWVRPMPFALLISIIIGVTNVIPFFGPFIGAIPSVMILLLVDPISAIWFVVFVILLQQFDGNWLGPKILGDSTGLPALWVLVAIIVGGGLFGFTGMLLGVPTAAVLYTLASDFVANRLRKKGMDPRGDPKDEPPAETPEAPEAAPAPTGEALPAAEEQAAAPGPEE